jgi:hypothetical protein
MGVEGSNPSTLTNEIKHFLYFWFPAMRFEGTGGRVPRCCMKSSPHIKMGIWQGILLTVQRDRSSYPSGGAR